MLFLQPDRIWRDATVREHFTSQEYKRIGLDDAGSKLRLGTGLGCVLAMEKLCNTVIPEFKVPFCIIHGTEDAGVPIDGSKFMMKTVQTSEEDKNLHCIEGAYHDMMGDPDAEVALGYWMTFVQERISKHRE
jgi:pimeloyl-ACP methyl ester carboxylesterase